MDEFGSVRGKFENVHGSHANHVVDCATASELVFVWRKIVCPCKHRCKNIAKLGVSSCSNANARKASHHLPESVDPHDRAELVHISCMSSTHASSLMTQKLDHDVSGRMLLLDPWEQRLVYSMGCLLSTHP